jgi:hypothetical protein
MFQKKTIDFAAPIVQDHGSLPGDVPFGSIIYDNTSGGFLGLSNSGTWQTLSNVTVTGANTSLSNLASTAINADLLPNSDNTINLGNGTGFRFANLASTLVNGMIVGFGGGNINTNTAVGFQAFEINGGGYENAVVGASALHTGAGNYNVAIGSVALKDNGFSTANVAIGAYALTANATGGHNVAIGYQSMFSNSSGSSSISMGENSAYRNTTGNENVALGYYALYNNHVSSRNIVIGNSSFYNYDGTGDGWNTIVGSYTGGGITTGVNNTIIGSLVNSLPSNLSNNIIIADGAGNRRINVDSAGNTGIGTTTPSTTLQVAGQITPATDNAYDLGDAALRFTAVYAVNGTIQTSDVREKKDVQESDLGLDFIQKLRPVSYRWKNKTDSNLHYGLIAQETQKAIQDSKKSSQDETIVYRNPKRDLYGLNYSELIAPVIKAVQEIYSVVQGNSQEITVLKTENADLKARIEKLEKLVITK